MTLLQCFLGQVCLFWCNCGYAHETPSHEPEPYPRYRLLLTGSAGTPSPRTMTVRVNSTNAAKLLMKWIKSNDSCGPKLVGPCWFSTVGSHPSDSLPGTDFGGTCTWSLHMLWRYSLDADQVRGVKTDTHNSLGSAFMGWKNTSAPRKYWLCWLLP